MSESRLPFIELVLRGEALLDEVDDFVDVWHESDTEQSLEQFLGMTADEYALWLGEPDMLPYIIKARRVRQSLKRVLSESYNEFRMAARSNDMNKIERLRRWLEDEGKL